MALKRVGTGCSVHSQTASPSYSAQDFSSLPPPQSLTAVLSWTSLWTPDKTGNTYFAIFEDMVVSLDNELTK